MEEFLKVSFDFIERIIARKAETYSQKSIGYEIEDEKHKYVEMLIQDFITDNFLPQQHLYENRYRLWKDDGKKDKGYSTYIGNAIKNYLLKRRSDQTPRHRDLVRNIGEIWKASAKQGILELSYNGKGDFKTPIAARILSKTRCPSTTAEPPWLKTVLSRFDHQLIASIAKEADNQLGMMIVRDNLKAVLKQVFSITDRWIYLYSLCDELEALNPLLQDIRVPSAPPPGGIDSYLYVRLKECVGSLSEWQKRVYELNTDPVLNREHPLTNNDIAKRLKCSPAKISRGLKKIRKDLEKCLQETATDRLNDGYEA